MSPVANLTAFSGKPPYLADGLVATPTDKPMLDQGEQVLGDATIKWLAQKYQDSKGTEMRLFLGAFPAMEKGKSFLVVGQMYDPKSTTGFDSQVALATIDQLAADRTIKANNVKLATPDGTSPKDTSSANTGTGTGTGTEDDDDIPKKTGTAEDILAFFDSVKDKIKSNLELPDWAKEELKKDKENRKKWKVRLTVGVDQDGNLKRLEKQEITDEDIDKVSNALENAIRASAPFKDVPGFKQPELQFVVKLSGEKLKVEKPQTSTSL
jgi:Fe-S cluster assembly iron-binding protein IscA